MYLSPKLLHLNIFKFNHGNNIANEHCLLLPNRLVHAPYCMEQPQRFLLDKAKWLGTTSLSKHVRSFPWHRTNRAIKFLSVDSGSKKWVFGSSYMHFGPWNKTRGSGWQGWRRSFNRLLKGFKWNRGSTYHAAEDELTANIKLKNIWKEENGGMWRPRERGRLDDCVWEIDSAINRKFGHLLNDPEILTSRSATEDI